MRNVGRKLAFVLAACNHGTMIVNRFDHRMTGPGQGVGVGFQLLEADGYDPVEVELALQLIEQRRRFHGDGVAAIDCGANIGGHAIERATAMTGWGSVIASEAQDRLYYALAGNIASKIASMPSLCMLRSPLNRASHAFLSPINLTASNFGSLELKLRADTEFIGQPIDYSDDKTLAIQQISLDALTLPRVDTIKLDIQGMELEATPAK